MIGESHPDHRCAPPLVGKWIVAAPPHSRAGLVAMRFPPPARGYLQRRAYTDRRSVFMIENSQEHVKRKTLGVTLTAVTIMFGGAGVANATAPNAPVPSSTTSTLANTNDNNQDSDNNGLWGLAGLLGLLGLAGLKPRKDKNPNYAPGAGPTGGPNVPPRA